MARLPNGTLVHFVCSLSALSCIRFRQFQVLICFWNEFRFLRSGDRLLYILRRFVSFSLTLNSNRILIKKVKEIKLLAIK